MTNEKLPIAIEVNEGASLPDPAEHRLINAWSISLVGAIVFLITLCATDPDTSWALVKKLPAGIGVTFSITICSFMIALPIGFIIGLGRLSRNRFINLVASTYVEIIRGIPLLVQLFFIYYALSAFLNVQATVAAIVGLSVCYGAYLGEIFRAGINSVDIGQTEAARSLGFNAFETMIYIVLPQAWRTILPPVGNESIAMLKDTSLLSIVAVTDLFRIVREEVSVTYDYFNGYAVAALVYLIITLVLSKGVSLTEARLSHYDKR